MQLNSNKYQLILFDMDGTLYFQRPLQIHMGLKMLAACISPGGLREMILVLKFRKLRENWMESSVINTDLDQAQYAALSAQTGVPVSQIEAAVQKWIYDKPLEIIGRYRDNTLAEIIKKYHLQNIQVAIYSDYPALDKRDALKLPPIPCFYGGQENISCMKPHPKGLQTIMTHYGITTPSKVLMVGDRQSKDGQAAIAAGTDYLILKKHKFQRKKQYHSLLAE